MKLIIVIAAALLAGCQHNPNITTGLGIMNAYSQPYYHPRVYTFQPQYGSTRTFVQHGNHIVEH